MASKFIQRLKITLNAPESTASFALFRILFCLLTLSFVYEAYFFKPIFFGSIDGFSHTPFPANLLLSIWTFCLCMVCFGFYTRVFATANYFLTVVVTAFFTSSNIGTFNDDLLRIGSFLLIFMPVSRSFSVDALIAHCRYKCTRPKETPYSNYFFAVFLSLGLLYVGSGLTKTYSDMWTRGLGLWIPSSMPYNHWNELYLLYVDVYWLVAGLNWLVILFELLFIILLFNKRLHWLIAVIGISLHIGIALIFPFPKIAIGPIVFYSLLIPGSFWKKLSSRIRAAQQLTVEVNPHDPRHVLIERFFSAIDYRKKYRFMHGDRLCINGEEISLKNGIGRLFYAYLITMPLAWLMHIELFGMLLDYTADELVNKEDLDKEVLPASFVTARFRQIAFGALIAFIVCMQVISQLYHAYSYHKGGPQDIVKYYKSRKNTKDISMKPSNLARTFFGINSRGVFLDHSNRGVKNIYAVTYMDRNGKEIWLPFIDERGFSAGYNMNMDWPRYTFNSVCFSTNPADPGELKKYTSFWAMKNHFSLDRDSGIMHVYRKQLIFPRTFETGYHLKLRNLPWEKEGDICWHRNHFQYTQLYIDTVYKPIPRD